MSYALAVSRALFQQFWLRIVFTRRNRFKPLLRAEFAQECFFDQAGFLLKAGYYNAAVCMARLAVEKALHRLIMIHPDWQEYRCQTLTSRVMFLYQHEGISSQQKNRLNSWGRRANKYAHQTAVSRDAARKIVHEAELLRPLIARATESVLQK